MNSLFVLADVFTTTKGIVGVVFGVGALIFFHELGHYLAAKWAGVKVEVFSLGFGRRLCGFQRGGTDYRVSMLPLGGYVKMLGQADDDPSQAPTDREDDFRNKGVGKRFVILVAGVVMNVLLAGVGFVLTFALGMPFNAPEVGQISLGSAAARADLQPGDIILEIDDSEILGWQDLRGLIALGDGERKLKVLRDGKTFETTAKPVREEGETFARLGVSPRRVVATVEDGSPLAKAGVQASTPTQSDRILNVSPVTSRCDPSLEMKLEDWIEVVNEVKGPLTVTVERRTFDPVTHLPTGSKTFRADVEFERRPVYTIGVEAPEDPYVRGVREESAAAKIGLKPGDRLLTLDGGEPLTFTNLPKRVREVGAKKNGQPARLVIERESTEGGPKRLELDVVLEPQNRVVLKAALEGVAGEEARLQVRRDVGSYLLGIEYRADIVGAPLKLPLADPEEPAVELQPGDRLVSIWRSGGLYWSKELPCRSVGDLREELTRRKDEPFRLTWQPKGSDEERMAVVKAAPHPTETYAHLGVEFNARPVVIQRGPIGACVLGTKQTWIQTGRILLTLRAFFTGGVSTRELGGPIQIVNLTYTIASDDSFARLLHLLAILSVNLAVINILPIPVLDGGHIFFLLVEKLKGRPVSGEVMIWAQWIGLACILALFALVFFNDITRLGQ